MASGFLNRLVNESEKNKNQTAAVSAQPISGSATRTSGFLSNLTSGTGRNNIRLAQNDTVYTTGPSRQSSVSAPAVSTSVPNTSFTPAGGTDYSADTPIWELPIEEAIKRQAEEKRQRQERLWQLQTQDKEARKERAASRRGGSRYMGGQPDRSKGGSRYMPESGSTGVGANAKEIKDLKDEIREEEYNELISQGYRPMSLLDATWRSLNQGYLNTRYGEESYKELGGQKNEKQKYADILDSEEYRYVTDNPFLESISGAAQLLGQQARQFTNPKTAAMAGTAAGAASIAGKVGPQVLAPEEVITVPSAFMGGLSTGMALNNFQVEAGLSYNELLENGVSQETAKKIALGVGTVNAALEMLQLDELLGAFDILKINPGTQTAARRIADELLARGIDVANETLQETAQEGVTIAGTQLGSKLDKGEWAYDSGEVLGRLGDTALSSAMTFGLMNVPAGARNISGIMRDARAGENISNSAPQLQSAEPPAQQAPVPELEQAAADVVAEEAGKDALMRGLENGRIDQANLTEEQIGNWDNHPDVWLDAGDRVYQMTPEDHIDQRTPETVGSRKVMSFQFDHPELHGYFSQAARSLSDDLASSIRGERWNAEVYNPESGAMETKWMGQKRAVSDPVAYLLDDQKLSYADIEKALDAIINDHGQENYAAAKRVELVLDDMLTNGYTTVDGRRIAPDQAYIDAKSTYPGSTRTETGTVSDTFEELPLPDDLAAPSPAQTQSNEMTRQAPQTRTQDERAIDTARVERASSALGENGQKALNATYDGQTGAREYYGGFSAYYQAGVSGQDINKVRSDYGNALTPAQKYAAYSSGKNDAAASLKMEKETVGFAPVDSTKSGLVADDYVKGVMKSGKKGADGKTYLSSADFKKLNSVCKDLGVRAVFVDEIDGGIANAKIEGADIQIAKDHDNPLRFVLGHELTHRMQELAPEEYRAFREYVAQDSDAMAGVERMMELYERSGVPLTYEGALDEVTADYAGELFESSKALDRFIEQHRTDRTLLEKLRDAFRALWEKLTGKEKQQAGEAEKKLTAALEAATRQAEQNRQAAAKAEGGETKYSINEQFGQNIQEWDKDGRPAGEQFVLGTTGPVLQGLGAIESDIYMNGDKISSILEQHPEMTIQEIQRIPDILEDPVLVLKSKNTAKSQYGNSRLVMFGSVKAQDGRPVMCVLDLRPTENGFLLDDMQKVTSAYTKDTNPVNFIQRSEILHADKKRTVPLLRDVGFTRPASLLQDGSMGSISYNGKSVNLTGEKFSDVVELVDGDGKPLYSLKDTDSQGRELTKEQREFFRDSKITDAEGQPLVLYHGTTAYGDITKFRRGRSGWLGPGIYLSSRQADAQRYANAMGEGNGKLYELYANVTNPLVVTGSNPVPEILRAAYGRDSVYQARSAKQGNDTKIITPADIKKLQSKGYDGIRWDFGKSTEVSVFSPEQIKRVDNKSPTENPDIRYSLKGEYDLLKETRKLERQARKEGWSDQKLRQERRNAVDRVYNALLKEYGAIAPGEKPARNIQVPKKTSDTEKVSQTVRTILEAKATPDEAIPDIQELVAKGEFSYETITDKEAIAKAESGIKDDGWGEALRKWEKDMDAGKVSKANTALGWALYNNAANSGHLADAMEILQYMVRHQRNAAQALQATRILKKLSPEGQLYGVVKSVEGLQKELNDRYGDKKSPDLKIDPEMGKKLLEAKDQKERDAALRDIYRDIGRQMPSRFIDKWNAWRYLSMLGNPRTHVRNVVGNAGFAPVVAAKDMTATAIEAAVNAVSGGRLERSKGFVGLGKQGRALLGAAWSDYDNVAEAALGGGKYDELANANKYIEEGRVIFKGKTVGKALEAARKANSRALDAEDMWFSKPHYAYALAQFCAAHKITEAEIRKGNPQVLAAARNYAIKEAQKATYRDTNALSQTISHIGRDMTNSKNPVKKAVSFVAEGIIPFRKTPANILARGLEYSPLGLMKGLSYDLAQVKQGKISGAEAIDNISAGLTGTGLLALGGYLAAEGLIRGGGSGDDKEKELEKLQGHQDYSFETKDAIKLTPDWFPFSLEIPGGTSVTLDWLAPEALPFFVGVNLWETAQREGGATLSDWLDAAKNISDPMLEMSCLQGLNDAIEAGVSAYSNDNNPLASIAIGAATSYLTQGLPTILGQAERTAEEERETTYTEKNAFLTPDMQYTLGKISGKIPVWDYQQIPYIDAWGRHESSGAAGTRAFNNFLNPAYTSQIEETPVEKELLRLYQQTGEAGVLPKRAGKYFTVNGERRDLSSEEYVKYAENKGKTSLKLVTDLTKNKLYSGLEDGEKAECVGDAYTYANQTARAKIDSKANMDSWVSKAQNTQKRYNVPVDTYIIARNSVKDIESLKDEDGESIPSSKGLQIMQEVYKIKGLNDAQYAALFSDFGVGKTVIGYNRAAVDEALGRMKKQAAK